MFPVGQYKKSFVKQLAREAGLDHIVQKKEANVIQFSSWYFFVFLMLVFLAIGGLKFNRSHCGLH